MIISTFEYYQSIGWLSWVPDFILILIAFFQFAIPSFIFALFLFVVTFQIENRYFGDITIHVKKQEKVTVKWIRQLISFFRHIFHSNFQLYSKRDRRLALLSVILFAFNFTLFLIVPFGDNMIGISSSLNFVLVLSILLIDTLAFFLIARTEERSDIVYFSIQSGTQMLASVLVIFFSITSVFPMTKITDLQKIVQSQSVFTEGIFPAWSIFRSLFAFIGFLCFFFSIIIIMQLLHPTGRQYLRLAGHTRQANSYPLQFVLLFASKVIALFSFLSVGVIIFLGGWLSPFLDAHVMKSTSWQPFWLLLKVATLYILTIVYQYNISNFSMRQIANINMKILLPVAFFSALGSLFCMVI